MMDRILEPELMNEEEQAKAYAFADFSKPHDMFVEIFQEKFPGFSFNDIFLDLGCGPCDVTRRMAKVFPDAGFHAVDGAIEMIKFGQQLNYKTGMAERIRLVEASLPNVDLPQQHYHAIISNSLLHHLHDPYVLWKTIQQHAKPFAHIFIMDLMRPIDEATVKFLVNEYAADEPEVLQKDFENSLHAAFTVKEVREQLDEMGFDNLTVEEASDRHLIVYGNL